MRLASRQVERTRTRSDAGVTVHPDWNIGNMWPDVGQFVQRLSEMNDAVFDGCIERAQRT